MNTRKQELVVNWLQELSTGIELDTKEMQLHSLRLFLSDIGYTISQVRNGKRSIYQVEKTKGIRNGNPRFMKLEEAVALHNRPTMKTNGTIVEFRDYTFNRTRYAEAVQNSMLMEVHLQRSHKEEDNIKVTSNWVRFN